MAQFKRQKPLRAGNLQGARPFSGTHPTSLLGPPPGLLNPPVSADLIQNARHLQVGEKQRVFTGIVTSLHDYFGVVDEEVFFQLSVVKGRLPQIGEKVLVKAVYNPSQSVPWNAMKVQTLSNQPLLKAPTPLLHVASLGQKQGILGAQPQLLFQPHRIPPLFPQKPMSLFQSSPSLHLGHLGRYPGRGPKGRQDSGRWDDFDSKKRKQKGGEPWGVKKPRHDPPQYRVYFARYAVDSPFCDAMEILRRYCSIQLPREFYEVRLCWLDTFPLTQPLTLRHPSRILVADPAEEVPETEEDATQEDVLEDTDPAFSAKVMLLSSPGLEELYRHCLLYIEEPSEQKESPEHPTKQIKFLLGRKEDEAVLIGGEWSPSLDGLEPDSDPMVLVRTAIRCTKAQTGLDLSACTKWFRFAEFRYLRQGDPSQRETVVIFLPDVWSCMPPLEEWEALCQQKPEKAPLPPPSPEEKPEMDVEIPDAAPDQEMEASAQDVDATNAAAEPAPTPPLEPAIIAHPKPAMQGGQPSCSNISLCTLLEYRRRREKLSFEVAVVAELFQEMLQRDFGYKLYKALLALPAKEEPSEAKNLESEKPAEHEKVQKEEAQEETTSEQEPVQTHQEEEGAEQKPACSEGSRVAKEDEKASKVEPKDSTDELCMLSLEDDLLLLRDDEEEDFGRSGAQRGWHVHLVGLCRKLALFVSPAGVKLDDAEVRSIASNQSEMEFSSLQDLPKELDPSAVLPLDALLAFIYFDLNFCGYLHRRDLEKILMTLGLHLCKEQVKQLVNRVVTQYVCQYRSLHYNRQDSADHVPEEGLLGNLSLLPASNSEAEVSTQPKAVVEHGDLISHNGTVLNVGKLLEKAEQTESSRLYLESKIHTLEVKLEEAQIRYAATESSNKVLTTELQAVQKQLADMEEQVKSAERQKSHFQRLLQENKKRLVPLQLEIQKIIEKTNNCLEKKEEEPSSSN
ncbi:cell cycle and apoptosis regulator protein 2 isoform X2 [Malaclemys terrapin pileata]|uniref:cell cycle and apoptosis regulator protein 2 isoform X2 n=1 Tax=Malaclemys terrapin pileata TaxID=2991368 RepID=UPI0023A792A3|nr:cell cycle and apoptosis regulator protein 2 isoform X2 [Malaclemys terrapin pileata]